MSQVPETAFVVLRGQPADEPIPGHLLYDPAALLHERLCGDAPSLCVIRPDGHPRETAAPLADPLENDISEDQSQNGWHSNQALIKMRRVYQMARMRRPVTPETTLYAPVKRYLERLGFTVKGEVCGCDLVALRGEEPPIVVIGELKSAFSLELVLQGVNRTAACDEVWLAVRVTGRGGRVRDPRVHKLCRFLGFGLLGVLSTGSVEVLVEPKPWRPRQDPKRRARLVQEHRSRVGDPALGGSTKMPIMTAYRQQALACAASLTSGPRRTREIRSVVPNASSILLRNFYGWFARIERGVYALTPQGASALARWPQPIVPAQHQLLNPSR